MHTESTPYNALPQGRARLAALLRSAGNVISIDEATRTLNLSRTKTAKLLARWTKQGWLRRVGSGVYVSAQLDSLQSELVLQDPWVLVPALFSPGYVGGRTAAEYWDLTEQIFRDIIVLTTQIVRKKKQIRHGANFTLKHITSNKLFGTKSVWRNQTKIAVSDVHRTIVDCLDDPALGGGIQHVWDCLNAYLKRADRDDVKLIDYAKRLNNGAIFKRLGFLAERAPNGTSLATKCSEFLTKGNSKLDPSMDCPKLITKWRLWIPPSWS